MNDIVSTTSPVPITISKPSPTVMLDRLVRDVSVPTERMREALPVVLELAREAKRAAFEAAFPSMSEALPVIAKRGKIGRKTGKAISYAKIEDIMDEVRPVLKEHGFGIRFRLNQDEKGVTAKCVLSHSGGHVEETEFWVPLDMGTADATRMTPMQAWGSARSYAMRYALTAALGIVARDEDDDGNGGFLQDVERIDANQHADIMQLLAQAQLDPEILCGVYNIRTVADLKMADFSRAVNRIENYINKQKAANETVQP